MERVMKLAMPLVAVASLTLAACNGAPGEVDEKTGATQQAAVTTNALVQNALVQNALVQNALVQNALIQNALVQNALVQNALIQNALTGSDLTSANSREVFSYIVSCALPEGAAIVIGDDQGNTYEFDGELGLTPEWGQPGGSCDKECQEWVSACVIARLDYLGKKRDISLRGDNPALAVSKHEAAKYGTGEATYFGDIFTAPEPMRLYAALYPGQTEDTRVCGPSVQSCGALDIEASADQVCGPQAADGSFPNCRPHDGDEDDPPYRSITVFLK